MSQAWFYTQSGQRKGPVTSLELKQLATNGQIQPTDSVWKEGMTEWSPAGKVKGLFNEAPTARSRPFPEPIPAPLPPVMPDLPAPVAASTGPVESVLGSAMGSLKGVWGKMTAANPLSSLKANPESPPPDNLAAPIIAPRYPMGVLASHVAVEVVACYEGGHPNLFTKGSGRLLLAETGIYFVGDQSELDLTFLYAHVRDVPELRTGEFPQKMVDRSTNARNLAKLGAGAVRMAGTFMGGSEGRALKAVGGAASEAVHATAHLGPPPKNRLCVVILLDGVTHKVLFDVGGDSKESIESNAEAFWFRVATVRKKFGVSRPKQINAPIPAVSPSITLPELGTFGSVRLRTQNQSIDSIPVFEFMQRLRDGQVADSDLIAVETWLPISTIKLLLGPCQSNVPDEVPIAETHPVSTPTNSPLASDIPIDLIDVARMVLNHLPDAPTGIHVDEADLQSTACEHESPDLPESDEPEGIDISALGTLGESSPEQNRGEEVMDAIEVPDADSVAIESDVVEEETDFAAEDDNDWGDSGDDGE